MQAIEALTRLLAMGEHHLNFNCPEDENPEFEQDKVAVAICTAMVNTAIPVARFRAFVKIESGGHADMEYTVCCVTMKQLIAALAPMSIGPKVDLYITVFEQRTTGADMLCGYQGPSRSTIGKASGKFKRWLEQLPAYEAMPTVQ